MVWASVERGGFLWGGLVFGTTPWVCAAGVFVLGLDLSPFCYVRVASGLVWSVRRFCCIVMEAFSLRALLWRSWCFVDVCSSHSLLCCPYLVSGCSPVVWDPDGGLFGLGVAGGVGA